MDEEKFISSFLQLEILETVLLAGYDLSDETKEDKFLSDYWTNLAKKHYHTKDNCNFAKENLKQKENDKH